MQMILIELKICIFTQNMYIYIFSMTAKMIASV